MSSIVASITGQRGGNSGGAGLNYNADRPDLQMPTTVDQANTQYAQAQEALNEQRRLVSATTSQGGLQHQAEVYNQQQAIANGTGPNPAQTMLNNQTGQNIAATTAAMAGQRGASQNVGLIARQAAQQGANIQQQAVGQGAALQAQQSAHAIDQAGGIAGQQVAQQQAATGAFTGATQGEQGQILSSLAQQNNAQVGGTSSANSANAGVSGIAAQGQQKIIGNVMGGIGAALMAEGGEVSTSTAAPTVPGVAPAQKGPSSKMGQYLQSYNQPNKRDALEQGSFDAGKGIGTGLKKGFSSVFGSKPAAGPAAVDIATQNAQMLDANRPDMLEGTMTPATGGMDAVMPSPADAALAVDPSMLLGADGGGIQDMAMKLAPMLMAMARGGKVQALLSPGERYLNPKDVKKVEQGKESPLKAGKTIPGSPKVSGAKNSYANDTVKATLDEGGIVLPRSVTQAKDAPEKARAFVAAIQAKKRRTSLPAKGR